MVIGNITNKTDGYLFTELNTRTDTIGNGTDLMKVFDDIKAGTQTMSSTNVNKGMIVSSADTVAAMEEALKAKAEIAKDNLTTLFNKLETMDAKAISEDEGINDVDADKVVSVVEEIKIMLATYCENYVPTGSLDVDAIKEVVGNTAMAMKVINKLSSVALPVTEDNVNEVMQAYDRMNSIEEVSEQAKAYLIKNDMEPNIENVYKAVHSAPELNSTSIDMKAFDSIKSQVEDMLKANDYKDVVKGMETAKWLYENGMELTVDNISKYDAIDSISTNNTEDNMLDLIVDALKYQSGATKALMTNERSNARKVVDAINTLREATKQDVAAVAKSGETFNIMGIRRVQEYSVQAIEFDENNSIHISYYRQLEETRLMMTSKSAIMLVEKGIDIDLEEMSKLVESLKELEMQEYSASYEEVDKALELRHTFNEVANLPMYAIGANRDIFAQTAVSLYESGTTIKMQMAVASYETMRTEIRYDLKDSLKKAIDNSVYSILNELNLADSKANLRAVSIMAYNSMEMTIDNVNAVKEMDSMLNNLFDNMTPEVALKLVREKKNPLNTKISELNDYIEQLDISTKGQKYSEFLFQLDKKHAITEEERENYIGIYKMFNSLKADSMNAVGALLKQGSEFNLENLMTMYQSIKDSGINVTLAEDTEYKTTANSAFYKRLFTRAKEHISAEALMSQPELMSKDLELLVDDLEAFKDDSLEQEYYREQLNDLAQLKDLETDVIRILTDNAEPVTINNLWAASDIKNKKLYEKLENITDMDELYSAIKDTDDLADVLDKLDESVKEYVNEQVMNNTKLTYADMLDLRRVANATGIMNSLAKKNEFVIPLKLNGRYVDLNLKLVQDSEQKGRLSINYDNVGIECNVSVNTVEAYIFCEADVSKLAGNIKKSVEAFGYEQCNVYHVTTKKEALVFENGNKDVEDKKLYELAKTIIGAIQ
ncbi:MAG: hypothetical protein IJY81_08155 [Lachnospiraceae bacterium]|nr:hypothetical protein [Lachnospiraceae bacterium]